MKKLIVPFMVSIMVFIFVGYVHAGMPNVADIYCSDLGYIAETITENDGGQHSICIFPDGSSCDTWRFLEGTCGETYSYCAQKGYGLKVKTDGKNPFSLSPYYAVCVDKHGKEVGIVTDMMGFQKKYMKPLYLPKIESKKSSAKMGDTLQKISGADLAGASLPSSFDWRTHLGFDWTTPPKNQSSCGACWAFSPVGVTEAAYNIKTNLPNLDLNLSEEYLNSDCDIVESGSDAGSCCGGSHHSALDFIKNYGISDEACLRFNSTYHSTGNPCDCFGKATGCPLMCTGMPTNCSQYLCADRCADYVSRLFTITDYVYVPNDNAGIKQKLIEKGPLSVCLGTRWALDPQNVLRCTTCWDRNGNGICDTAGVCNIGTKTCSSGIVGNDCNSNADCDEDKNDDGLCTQDDCGTNHCISIVGYNDALNAWIVKDNYGTSAGVHHTGFYEVGYGECHIEDYVYYVEVPDIAIPPMISIPGNLTFANTCIAGTSYETLNICNTGEANLKVYSIVSDNPQFEVQTLPLSPNPDNPNPDLFPVIISPDFCYPFNVKFSPTSTGTQTATLTISSNDIGHDTVKIQATGNGIQQDIVAMIADSGNFGDVCVGSQKDLNLTINNSGGCELSITSITSDSGQFQVPGDIAVPLIISAGGNIQVPIRFKPTSSGSKSAHITITSNAPSSPTTVAVSGNAPSAKIVTAIANTGNFGDVCIGTFKDLPLTINNTGGCNLSVSNITSSTDEFIAPGVTFPLIVSPGASTIVTIRFKPSSLGVKSANITIVSDDPVTPNKNVSVSGNVPPGDIRVTGSTDFGDVCAETLAEKTISVCNVGECNLSVTSAAFTPACADFLLNNNNPFPATVSKDSCIDLVIRFTPTSAGPKSCTLVITSDDPDTPNTTMTVTANTPEAMIDVSPDQAFLPEVIQSIDACQSQKPFPISNKGNCNLRITNIAIGGENGSDYSLSGLPSFPIILEPGHVAGEGNLNTVFAPIELDRDRIGNLTVTYQSDPITHSTSDVTRTLCGEGVRTGARVLVTVGGMPVDIVKKIQIQRIGGNRNKKIVDTVDVAQNVPLMTETPLPPCQPFQYHKEYGTVSNPVQLLPGSYQVTATAVVNGKNKNKTVSFDVSTCDFNPNIVINF